MSEELYNSHDYCLLAEQYEELKKENAELARDKDHLMNLFMERSEYVFDVVANMKIESLTQKYKALEADYEVSNREMLITQVEIGRLKSELARRDEELKITDGLLKEATETIGAVIACCTYNSNDDAKIGIYGIDQNAFTKIDQFITRYNDAVSADKVSVDVKRDLSDTEIRKEFCPNCEAETPCTHEAELFVCDICGEDFAKYIVSRNCSVSDVSMTQDVLTDIETGQSIEIEDLETVVEHLKIRLSEWQGVARQLADELVEANSERLPVSWEEPGETSRAMIAYRNLVDIEDMEANDAKQRS